MEQIDAAEDDEAFLPFYKPVQPPSSTTEIDVALIHDMI